MAVAPCAEDDVGSPPSRSAQAGEAGTSQPEAAAAGRGRGPPPPHAEQAWAWFRSIGAPKLHVAPMVDQVRWLPAAPWSTPMLRSDGCPVCTPVSLDTIVPAHSNAAVAPR